MPGTGARCSQQGGDGLCMAWTWAEGLSCWGLLYPTAVPSASTLLSHLTPGPKDWENLVLQSTEKASCPLSFLAPPTDLMAIKGHRGA